MEAVEVQEEAEVVEVAAAKSEQNAKTTSFVQKSKSPPRSLKHGTALNRCCQDRVSDKDDENNNTSARAPARCPSPSLTSSSVSFTFTPVHC